MLSAFLTPLTNASPYAIVRMMRCLRGVPDDSGDVGFTRQHTDYFEMVLRVLACHQSYDFQPLLYIYLSKCTKVRARSASMYKYFLSYVYKACHVCHSVRLYFPAVSSCPT